MTESNNSTRLPRKQEGSVTLASREKRAPKGTDPKVSSERPIQAIRGGYLIVRRKAGPGFLRRIAKLPFEHGTLEEAEAQAAILAARHRDEFSVFRQVATALPPALPEAPQMQMHQAPAAEPVAPSQPRPVIVERRTKRFAGPRTSTQGGHS